MEPTRAEINQAYANALAIIDRLQREQLDLLAALKVAVETIRIWQSGSGTKQTEAEVWALYQQSPEMQLITAAIAKAEGR